MKILPEQPRQTDTRSIWSVESHPRIFLGVIGTKSPCKKTQQEKIQSIFIENLLIFLFSFLKNLSSYFCFCPVSGKVSLRTILVSQR